MKQKSTSNIHGLVHAQLITNSLEYGPIATLITNNLGALRFRTLDPTTTQNHPNKHSNILQVHTQVYPPASIEFL